MAKPDKYAHIDFKPPNGVRREAEYGLKLRREHGRGGTAVGIARARDLSNGVEVSPSTVRRMKAFFDRHASDAKAPGFDRGDEQYPSNGLIANKLWGGPSGYSWSKKIVAQMEAADRKAGDSRSLRPYGSTHGMKPRVKVVYGAPGSGKSEYVWAKKRDDDVVFDFDRIMSAISGLPYRQHNKRLISYCTDIRALILKKALYGNDNTTWIITTRVNDDLADSLGDIPVEYIEMEATKDECLKRVNESPEWQPVIEEIKQVIDEYFSDREEQRSADTRAGVERRYLGNFSQTEKADPGMLRVERRADPSTGKPRTYLVGYAAVFHKDSLMLGDFIERIHPDAFQIVKDRQDEDGKPLETRCLFNHSADHLLGRFPTTMRMTVDDKGLRYECLLPESRADVAELVERGDLKGSSFSFVVHPDGGEEWKTEDGQSIRVVKKIKALLDCGPVTYPAYGDASVAVAKRSYETHVAERRDCGKNPDGTFAEGNTCSGGSSISESKESMLGRGAAAGFSAGNLVGKPILGAAAGALVGSLISTKSQSLEKAYARTGVTVDKAKKVADIFGDHMQAKHHGDARGSYGLTLSGNKVEVRIERGSGKKGVNAQVFLYGGEDPNVHMKAILKAAKALGVNTVTVSVGKRRPDGTSQAQLLQKAGFEKAGDNESNIFFTKQVKKWDASQKPKPYRAPKKDVTLAEKALYGASLVKSTIDLANDTHLIAKGTAALSKALMGTGGVPYAVDGGVVRKGKWSKRSSRREISASVDSLKAFLAERRSGECGRDESGRFGSGNKCQDDGGGDEDSDPPAEQPASDSGKGVAELSPKPKSSRPNYMEVSGPMTKAKAKAAQKFIDDARQGQLERGGKDGGQSDDGGGVQTWSKGDSYPWTTKQVGTDSGYLQAQHPDGSKTQKYTFERGDTKPALDALNAELKKKGKKPDTRSLVTHTIAETMKFLRERR